VDGVDDGVDVEVAVLRRRRPDADRLVGRGDVERVHIGVGIDCDGADAEPPRRAHDAAGDLTPVGDQELGEHLRHPPAAAVPTTLARPLKGGGNSALRMYFPPPLRGRVRVVRASAWLVNMATISAA